MFGHCTGGGWGGEGQLSYKKIFYSFGLHFFLLAVWSTKTLSLIKLNLIQRY